MARVHKFSSQAPKGILPPENEYGHGENKGEHGKVLTTLSMNAYVLMIVTIYCLQKG